MADRVTIVCADGLGINCSIRYYKTLSDVAELDKEVQRVPIPFDSDLVSRVMTYRCGYVPTEEQVLQALEVLHYLQADGKVIARWTRYLPSNWWSKLPEHVLHMLYTTGGSLTVSTEVQLLLANVITVCGSSAISYHAAMLLKWQATNTAKYCKNHMMVIDKNDKHGWSMKAECGDEEMCRYSDFSLIKYLDGLDTRYAGLNVVSHTYDDWLAAGKDIKAALESVLSQSKVIELGASVRILTRVCEVASRNCDMELLKSIKTSKIIVDRYNPTDRHGSMHRLLGYCASVLVAELRSAGVLKYKTQGFSGKLVRKIKELAQGGGVGVLRGRYEPDPAIAAAEEAIGSKPMDLFFCWFSLED